MMQMSNDVWRAVYDKDECVDTNKKVMMTLAFDRSEDHLAYKKFMDLADKELLVCREKLMKSQTNTLNELKKQITLPRVCRRKQSTKT